MALLKIKSLESSNTLLTHIGYKLKICHNSKKKIKKKKTSKELEDNIIEISWTLS